MVMLRRRLIYAAANFAMSICLSLPALADDCSRNLTPKRLKELRFGAMLGDASSQTSLGAAYLYGWGVDKNEVEAVKWLRKAAEQGQPLAQFDMGSVYQTGLGGVTKDAAQAFQWYRKSAELGNVFAQGNLASCYYTGFGVAKDDVQAYVWNEIADAKDTSGKTTQMRSVVEKSLSSAQIAEAKSLARDWMQQHRIHR